ncbi:MAG: hypothetical protein WC146_02715 [Patescibacteria group bacterium]|jgi:hypothetical protein
MKKYNPTAILIAVILVAGILVAGVYAAKKEKQNTPGQAEKVSDFLEENGLAAGAEPIFFEKTGNITKNRDDWNLIYEEPGKPALSKILEFTDSSECFNQSESKPCSPVFWGIGSRVKVEGWDNSEKVVITKLSTVNENDQIENEMGYQEEANNETLPICEDLCGDGSCQEIVCLGQGCPCAESPTSCPQDCAK